MVDALAERFEPNCFEPERFECERFECEADDRSEVFELPATFRLPEDLDFPESLALDGVFDFTDFLDFVGAGDCPAPFDVVWSRVFSNRSFFLLSFTFLEAFAFLEPSVFRDALAFPELFCFPLEFRELPFFDQRFGLAFLWRRESSLESRSAESS